MILREDPALARSYGAPKTELALRLGGDCYAYTDYKTAFIEAVLEKSAAS